MKSLATSISAQIIVRVQKVRIFLSEEGVPGVSIKLHPTADAVSFVQGVILKFSNDNEVILEAGIATLLHRAMLSISDAILEAEEKCLLTIPLEKNIPIMDSTKIKLYMPAGKGRIVSVKFEFQ